MLEGIAGRLARMHRAALRSGWRQGRSGWSGFRVDERRVALLNRGQWLFSRVCGANLIGLDGRLHLSKDIGLFGRLIRQSSPSFICFTRVGLGNRWDGRSAVADWASRRGRALRSAYTVPAALLSDPFLQTFFQTCPLLYCGRSDISSIFIGPHTLKPSSLCLDLVPSEIVAILFPPL